MLNKKDSKDLVIIMTHTIRILSWSPNMMKGLAERYPPDKALNLITSIWRNLATKKTDICHNQEGISGESYYAPSPRACQTEDEG